MEVGARGRRGPRLTPWASHLVASGTWTSHRRPRGGSAHRQELGNVTTCSGARRLGRRPGGSRAGRWRCEVWSAGVDLARQSGALGATAPTCGRAALLSLGRRDEAQEVLEQVFDLDLRHLRSGLGSRGHVRGHRSAVGAATWAAAQAGWAGSSTSPRRRLMPRTPAGARAGLAEAALWDGRLPEARAAVATGWRCWPPPTSPPGWHRAVPRSGWPWRRRCRASPGAPCRRRGAGRARAWRPACWAKVQARRPARPRWCRRGNWG